MKGFIDLSDILLAGMQKHNAEICKRHHNELLEKHALGSAQYYAIAVFMKGVTATWMTWPEADRALALKFLQEIHEHVKTYGIENS